MTRDSMLRHRGRAAADDDAGPARRPLIERDANSATAPRQHSGASKAKQSPMVDRARESQPDLGLSSSSRVSGMKQDVGAISMLKIPARLAGPQTARMRQGSLAVKRSNPAPPDPSIESPYKRATSVRDVSLPEGGQNAFVPLSLSLGALGAPQGLNPVRPCGPVRGAAKACVDEADSEPRGSNPQFVSELKAKLRQRKEAEEQRNSQHGIIEGVAMGLKDIRDVFYDFIENFKGFTSEIMRDDTAESDDDSPLSWKWTDADTQGVAHESPKPSDKKAAASAGHASGSSSALLERALHRAEDPDPWNTEWSETAFANAGGKSCSKSSKQPGMTEKHGPLTARRGSAVGNVSHLRPHLGGRAFSHSSPPAGPHAGLFNGPSGLNTASRLRHSPSGGSMSPMLKVYDALEEHLRGSPAKGEGGKCGVLSAVSCGGSSGSDTSSRVLQPRKTAEHHTKKLWKIQPADGAGLNLIKFTPPPRKGGEDSGTGSDVDEAWEDLLAIGASQKVQQAPGPSALVQIIGGVSGEAPPAVPKLTPPNKAKIAAQADHPVSTALTVHGTSTDQTEDAVLDDGDPGPAEEAAESPQEKSSSVVPGVLQRLLSPESRIADSQAGLSALERAVCI